MNIVADIYNNQVCNQNWKAVKSIRNCMKTFSDGNAVSESEAERIANDQVAKLKARISQLESEKRDRVKEIILSHKDGNQSGWTLYKNILKKAIAGGAAVMTAVAAACAAIGIPVAIAKNM